MSDLFAHLAEHMDPGGDAVEVVDELLVSPSPLRTKVSAAWMLGFLAAMKRCLGDDEFDLLVGTVSRDAAFWKVVDQGGE